MPITIELPDLKAQTTFNVTRWTEILADPRLAKLSDRIETDRHGHIIVSPPPAFTHADRQGQIADLLKSLLPNGRTLVECPLSTADGIKAVDLVWLDRGRPEFLEIGEKRALYFDADAAEVWICNLDGSMSFLLGPDHQALTSAL